MFIKDLHDCVHHKRVKNYVIYVFILVVSDVIPDIVSYIYIYNLCFFLIHRVHQNVLQTDAYVT